MCTRGHIVTILTERVVDSEDRIKMEFDMQRILGDLIKACESEGP